MSKIYLKEVDRVSPERLCNDCDIHNKMKYSCGNKYMCFNAGIRGKNYEILDVKILTEKQIKNARVVENLKSRQ